MVSEAIAGADPVARARGVRLGGRGRRGHPGRPPTRPSLSRVVSNLLMNAIRHTPADGVVEVHGRAVAGRRRAVGHRRVRRLSPRTTWQRVFDVAWQGSPARTPDSGVRPAPGAGLGLAIVKGIVEAHRGDVRVANAAPGCRFVVQLPA